MFYYMHTYHNMRVDGIYIGKHSVKIHDNIYLT